MKFTATRKWPVVILFNTLITKHRFIAEKLEAIFICQKKKLVTFSCARTDINESGSFCSSLKSSAFYIKLKIEYSSSAPITLAKFSTNFKQQKLKPKLRRIRCVSQDELNRLEKLFNDFSGKRFFVYYGSNFTIFPDCFDKRI